MRNRRGVDAESGGGEQEERDREHQARAEFVFAGGGDQDGTARRGTYRFGGLGSQCGRLRCDASRRRRRRGTFPRVQFTLQAFQVGAEFGGDLVAHVPIFFEGLVENALEFGGGIAIQRDGSHRSVVQDVVEDDGAGTARGREACLWSVGRGHRRGRRGRCAGRSSSPRACSGDM